jgi:two-component system, sensor histidine kinase and response regulator
VDLQNETELNFNKQETSSELKLLQNEPLNKLKELNESKDKFFSIISHDLRNPFHALMGLSDLLVININELSKDELTIIGENINSSTKNLLNLVNNLLEWAKLQTGKTGFNPSVCELFSTANNTISVLHGNAIKKKIQIENLIKENTKILADKFMLISIFQNILSNAIKFTNEGGYIIISQKSFDKFIEVSIKDNGVGMDTEVLKKLFKLDERQSTSGTANEKGSGLGLILCKDLIEMNGGNICVDSKLGKGTTFSFTLPAANS